MAANPNKRETTLSKLSTTLTAQGVTAITVVDADLPVDPTWFTVVHPVGVTLRVEFTAEATPEQKEAAKVAILAAVLKKKDKQKSVAAAVKAIGKLTPERKTRLLNLVQATFLLDTANQKILEKWGFTDLDLTETVVV